MPLTLPQKHTVNSSPIQISNSTMTQYRIIDLDTDSIVANGIPTLPLATLTLEQYQLNYPTCRFEIETYNKP